MHHWLDKVSVLVEEIDLLKEKAIKNTLKAVSGYRVDLANVCFKAIDIFLLRGHVMISIAISIFLYWLPLLEGIVFASTSESSIILKGSHKINLLFLHIFNTSLVAPSALHITFLNNQKYLVGNAGKFFDSLNFVLPLFHASCSSSSDFFCYQK